jgi:hypothetical protein
LSNLIISSNETSGYGGGMYNGSFSSPTLTNVTFSANKTLSYGGGMYNNSSNPTLTNVTFSGNQAISFGYGGGMYNDGSSPKLTNVTFSSNTTVNNGGGMFNKNSSKPVLTDVTFQGNSVSSHGAGIYNDNSSPTLINVAFNNNSASGYSGGIYDTSSNPTLTDVTFSVNSGAYGGGMYNYTSSPVLKDVTFNTNVASIGGGVYNYSSSPTLTNATFSANTASLSGPAMDNESGSSPFIYDSIFWNDSSGEIWNTSPGLTIANSIVAGGCPGGSTCSNVFNVIPILGPLQNNGGFTKTMALGAGSAAIDAGNNATCAPKDQRGIARPQGAACDMGAYEVKVMTFTSVGTYDGWILESAKASNIGGSLNSTNTTLRVGDDSSNKRYRGFLSFNTAPLPDGAAVVQAEVRVKKQSMVGNPFGTQGNLLADVVKPYFGSSLALVASDWQAAATVSSVGSFLPDGLSYWTPLNSSGRTNINKTGTTQFRLRFSTDAYNAKADYLALYSGDYTTNLSYRPLLIVYYNP